MATVTVKSTFPDGETLVVQVSGKTTYPDAVAELRATAVSTYTEIHRVRIPVEEP
jgi:hypothetical protein